MSRRTDLPRQDAAVADMRRACQADLPANNRVFADFARVPDKHQIINFRSATDSRLADSSAVDARIRLGRHVILDPYGSMLQDLVPTSSRAPRKSEPIAP